MTKVFDENSVEINTVCAASANKDKLDIYNNETKQDIKTSFGMLVIFKTIQYFAELGYKNIILNCNLDLVPYYYKNLFFEIGTHKNNNLTKQVYKPNGKFYFKEFIENHLELMDTISITEKNNYMSVEITEDDIFIKMFFNVDKWFKKLKSHMQRRIDVLEDFFEKYKDDPDILRSNNKEYFEPTFEYVEYLR